MTDLLRYLLDLREILQKMRENAEGYGILESLPELGQIDDLQYRIFAKVNEWSKPEEDWWPKSPTLVDVTTFTDQSRKYLCNRCGATIEGEKVGEEEKIPAHCCQNSHEGVI